MNLQTFSVVRKYSYTIIMENQIPFTSNKGAYNYMDF